MRYLKWKPNLQKKILQGPGTKTIVSSKDYVSALVNNTFDNTPNQRVYKEFKIYNEGKRLQVKKFQLKSLNVDCLNLSVKILRYS